MKNTLVVLLAASFLSACSIVGPGERGIRVSFGKASSEPLTEGLYLWLPILYGMKV